MTIRLINWPVREKICILERSFPRSHTTIFPVWRMTATLRGYQSWPSSLPGLPKSCLNSPSLSNIYIIEMLNKNQINNMRQINLNAMIVGVRDDDIFINAQTEAMRGIELPFCRTQLSKTNAGLHGDVLWIGCQGSTAAAGSIRGT